jgi:hypothetical protein
MLQAVLVWIDHRQWANESIFVTHVGRGTKRHCLIQSGIATFMFLSTLQLLNGSLNPSTILFSTQWAIA